MSISLRHSKIRKEWFDQYKKKCIITVITHSHGGNVALNLAQFSDTRDYDIETLILLAVPVQRLTQHFVDEVVFKNIFSTFSYMMRINTIDNVRGIAFILMVIYHSLYFYDINKKTSLCSNNIIYMII
jgi:uncharacterized membrane protein YcfT